MKVKGSEALEDYIWGDREIAFNHCKRCGCVTHWKSLAGQTHHLVGLNMRMAEPEEIEDLAIKYVRAQPLTLRLLSLIIVTQYPIGRPL